MDFFNKFLIYIFSVLFVVLTPLLISYLLSYFKHRIKGVKPKKSMHGTNRNWKYGSKLKRIFVDFPNRFALDRLQRDPDMFLESGVHIISGEQGSGKTITVVYLLRMYRKMYPALVVKTNFDYLFQDKPILHWKDVTGSNNGVLGEINVIDEIQTWFASLQSKDFPPEMLQEVSQQRKQRKMIIGTCQVFGRMGKPLREQTSLLYLPITVFGCITIVRVYKPVLSAVDGTLESKKLRKLFFFIHDEEIRNSFDTYKRIQGYVKEGFQPRKVGFED